ncbi:glycosyltransferase [uncultured Finegoldia sp.]|nr:glycosyltransferase [uncultured Finegoldia sp.]MDU2096472.1 glycosyltransferase [Negativicoccus succinicivorans]MDU4278218.1 glycosyltransferase [Finegoldia magna]
MKNYSVLMSVYYKERPEYLRQAMKSIFNQTVLTNDFVLICDGPLTEELDAVINEFKHIHEDILNVYRIENNVGLGNALNLGISECKNELVARMDSDDISRKQRCEKQLEIFEKDDSIDIVSGTIEEFVGDIKNVKSCRNLPEKNQDIIKFAKSRSPFNHACIMYKKNKVIEAGSYKDFYFLEDYYLWIRMLNSGCHGYNIQEPLLWVRAGNDMYKRRSGIKYVKSQKNLLTYMKKIGFINKLEFIIGVLIRTCVSLSPNLLRKYLYNNFLRNKNR